MTRTRLASGSVIRGGYARTYDVDFVQMARQIPGTFPFVKSVSLAPRTPNSLEALRNAAATPISGDTDLLSRTIASPDFRSPLAEQFSLQFAPKHDEHPRGARKRVAPDDKHGAAGLISRSVSTDLDGIDFDADTQSWRDKSF